MPPLRLILAGLLVIALGVLWRRPLRAAVGDTIGGIKRELRDASLFHYAALALIFGAGIWLRWDYWDVPMRWDESFTFLAYGVQKLSTGLSLYSPNNHPLNTLLIHYSHALFGSGHRAVRAPVFIVGILLPLAAYVATLRLYGRQVGLLVAAFFAGSAQLVEFSTNARGYELTAMAVVLMIALVPSLLCSTNPVYWALVSLIAALGLFAQSVFIYALTPLMLAVGLAGVLGYADYSVKRFIVYVSAATATAFAFAALLYGPLLSKVINFAHRAGGGYSNHPGHVGRELWRVWTLGIPTPLKLLLAIGLGLAVVFVWKRWIGRFPVAAMLLLVAVIVAAAGKVVIYTRYFLPVLPLVLFAAIVGLIGFEYARPILARRRIDIAVSVVAAAIAIGLAVSVSRDSAADQEGSALPSANLIAEYVKPRLGPEDKLLVSVCAWPIEAYAFYSHGWPFAIQVVASETADQAAKGKTYVVVNQSCGETLPSVLAKAAGGSGLQPTGRKVAGFPGADVYELSPVS